VRARWLLVAVLALHAGACREALVPVLDAGDLVPRRPDGGARPPDGGVDAGDPAADAGAPVVGMPDGGDVVVDTGVPPVDLVQLASIEIAAIDPLPVGRTAQLAAIGTFDDASQADVTQLVEWRSTTTAVAQVSTTGQRGVVTALAEGSTDVEAFLPDGGVAKALAVVVGPAVADELVLDPPATSAPLGAVMQLRAYVRRSDGVLYEVTESATWTSLDPAVAV
jgi:hypothetical protein